jgi:hypothetical protein
MSHKVADKLPYYSGAEEIRDDHSPTAKKLGHGCKYYKTICNA